MLVHNEWVDGRHPLGEAPQSAMREACPPTLPLYRHLYIQNAGGGGLCVPLANEKVGVKVVRVRVRVTVRVRVRVRVRVVGVRVRARVRIEGGYVCHSQTRR